MTVSGLKKATHGQKCTRNGHGTFPVRLRYIGVHATRTKESINDFLTFLQENNSASEFQQMN